MKVYCKMTNMAMDMMLQLLNEAFKSAKFSQKSLRGKKIFAVAWVGVRVNPRL